ncbi:hypothetical protein [Cupriavidus campinensis]|uniref:hypothetical protein n=1 Tax=Cupriavidus campinensis TaxID=151783 RepID=UPI0021CC515D|nr:hypothetical protein [Cupriavidus campinensis]
MLAAASLSGYAGDGLPDGFSEKPVGRFTVSKERHYRNPAGAIRHFLATFHKNDQRNHFCVVGYKWSDGRKQVWVHWREPQTLILWGGSRYPEYVHESLIMSNRHLELATDTVPTPTTSTAAPISSPKPGGGPSPMTAASVARNT